MMEFRLIDVVSIISKVPRSQFEEVELTQLAESILECEGVLTPPVLKVIGLDSYEVIEGDREYYAAVVAREKNPRKGEMINAFVVPLKYEENIRKQLSVLHRGLPTSMTSATPSITLSTASSSSTAPLELAELAEVVSRQVERSLRSFQSQMEEMLDKKLARLLHENVHPQAQLLAVVNQDRKEAKKTPDNKPGSSKLDCNNANLKELKAEAGKWKIQGRSKLTNRAELIEALKKVGACE